ncbi:restriction endonuclease subunit S [Roseburia sp.]
MANTPNIRFQGFTDDWEQRKLEDIYGSIGNAFVGTATPYYAEQGHFYLESNNVKDGQINHNSEIFINDEFYEKQKDKWLHTGDMVMVQSGHVGHAAVIPEELDNTAAHALIMFRNPKEEIEPYFLNYEYQTDKAKKKIENITTGNTIKHILASDMQEFVVDVPKYEEQKVIAGYFCNLDNLITLHQRKCDEMKKMKKFMLQKMFPKNGAKNPEIRFDGFTDDWEQRKLGKVCERITRKNINNESDLPLTIASQYGLIDQRDFFNKIVAAKDMSNYYLLKKGEFAYNKSYSKGFDYGSIKRLNAYEQGCLSTLYICFGITSDDVDSDYLECFFDTLKWYSDITMICAEGARNHGLLNVDTKAFFDEVTISMPSSKEEQCMISAYLKNLDHLITLHQRKADNLKNLKKYMLQNMFV